MPDPVVSVVPVGLGARTLLRLAGIETHAHGSRGVRSHLRLGALSLGGSHRHVDGEGFAAGMLNGVAGSGALVALLVSTADTVPGALSFLVGFGLLSIATMALVTVVWGRTFDTPLTAYLKVGAALLGIGVGAMLLAGQLPHLL